MGTSTGIEWTDTTWNPVRGCSRVSPGCQNCYAERMAHRFSGPGGPYEGLTIGTKTGPRWSGKVTVLPEMLNAPLRWRQPRTVFVNSMSDLFHEGVPDDFIAEVFATMERASWHSFQILTKRPARAAELADQLPWPSNVWLGTSVESSKYLPRVQTLRTIPAAIRFLSLEPLLGPLNDLELRDIDWVIVGGESGPHARPMNPEWVREIRTMCQQLGVPFFFKQWGGIRKKESGRALDGRTWDEMPQARSRA
jgi:protein gp37